MKGDSSSDFFSSGFRVSESNCERVYEGTTESFDERIL